MANSTVKASTKSSFVKEGEAEAWEDCYLEACHLQHTYFTVTIAKESIAASLAIAIEVAQGSTELEGDASEGKAIGKGS